MPTAEEMLASYLEAEIAVLKGQAYRLGDRMVTRADLAEIRNGRKEWQARADAQTAATAGRSSFGFAVARLDGGQ